MITPILDHIQKKESLNAKKKISFNRYYQIDKVGENLKNSCPFYKCLTNFDFFFFKLGLTNGSHSPTKQASYIGYEVFRYFTKQITRKKHSFKRMK
jgi:hypothetical protein